MERDEDLMRILREHLNRQRGEGITTRAQASTLYHLMENRGNNDYMQEFPEIAAELGLELDVDLSHRCLPGATPFFTWVEAEIWSAFTDQVEGIMGFETEVVQNNRAQPTMSDREMEAWRQWAGLRRAGARSRSRTPTRATRTPPATTSSGEQEQGQETEDFTSLMHRGTWSDPRAHGRRRDNRRRRTTRSNERDRSRRTRTTTGASSRELRIRERVTRETRRLGDECAASSWQSWQAEPAAVARTPSVAPRAAEMDILEATGRWFVMLGLRQPGQETHEPSSAMTRQMQAEARTTLRTMTDRDLETMETALLRLTGMIYIEAARLLTQARDDRRRTTEEVEVEIEADDEEESIYMQKFVQVKPGAQWGEMLQDLLRMAEQGGETNRGLLVGLQRRIRDSLYLHTDKGAQLQATLVVAVNTMEEGPAEVCDTEDNDVRMVEEWWGRLKRMMDLGGDSTHARGSDEQMVASTGAHGQAASPHREQEVQQWEEDRRELEEEEAAERRAMERQQREHEEEEQAQANRDEALYEQHRAGEYRDWEQWVVLNTVTTPKRRRLLVAASHVTNGTTATTARSTLTLPRGADRIDNVKLTLQFDTVPDLPDQQREAKSTEPALDPTTDLYQRAYQAWRAGDLRDDLVTSIFGSDWLFLFQINKDGVDVETLPEQEGVTQLDSEGGQGAMGEGHAGGDAELAGALADGDQGLPGHGHGVWGVALRTSEDTAQFPWTFLCFVYFRPLGFRYGISLKRPLLKDRP